MSTLPTLLLLASLLTCSLSAGRQLRPAPDQAESGADDEIPTVAFCEMLNRPHLYFDKALRLAATYRVGFEAAYLKDEQCVLSYRVKIGVGFVNTDEKQRDVIRKDVDKIMSGAYGNGRARVTVVGMLRNAPHRTGFREHRYRFDIIRFEGISREDVSHTIITYEGTLQAGKVYRARVRGDSHFGMSFVPTLRMPFHHTLSLEWTNLGEFRALKRLRDSSREQQIVFSVISDEVKQVTERRWNRMLRCEVILVE